LHTTKRYFVSLKCTLKNSWPGTVAQTYNPHYLVGREQEDHGSVLVQPRQKVHKTLYQPMDGHGSECLSASYPGNTIRKIADWCEHKAGTHLKNNQHKKG
jgi:hypothetical protein